MTKTELVRRWHATQTYLTKLGVSVELDMLASRQILTRIRTAQDLGNEIIEWGFKQWDDVSACWQTHEDGVRYFGIAFRKPKDYDPDAPEED